MLPQLDASGLNIRSLFYLVLDLIFFFIVCLNFKKVSIIERVAFIACGLLRIVASIYRPFSVNALGSFTFPPFIEVENFGFNTFHSFLSSSSIYPSV